jgi:hypothetical protein
VLSAWSTSGSSGVEWMRSIGHTSTHEVSLVPMHGSLITSVMALVYVRGATCLTSSAFKAGPCSTVPSGPKREP